MGAVWRPFPCFLVGLIGLFMDWSQHMGDIPGWIGCAASVALVVSTYRQHKRSGRLEERINELRLRSYHRDEESLVRAKLVMEIEREGRHSFRARVTNRGHADARNVVVDYVGPKENNPLVKSDPGLIPVSRLPSGGSFTFHLATHLRCFPPFNFRVRWSDGDGSEREEMIELGW